jgi:hypothetical protein
MKKIHLEQSSSVMPSELWGDSTIGAKPINAHSVVNPIRLRFRGSQIVWYLLGLIEVILMIRFLLEFMGANQFAGFTQFIQAISFPFAAPFINVIDSSQVGQNVFNWSLLLAALVYALVAWGLVKLFVMSKPVSDQEADSRLESQDE